MKQRPIKEQTKQRLIGLISHHEIRDSMWQCQPKGLAVARSCVKPATADPMGLNAVVSATPSTTPPTSCAVIEHTPNPNTCTINLDYNNSTTYTGSRSATLKADKVLVATAPLVVIAVNPAQPPVVGDAYGGGVIYRIDTGTTPHTPNVRQIIGRVAPHSNPSNNLIRGSA